MENAVSLQATAGEDLQLREFYGFSGPSESANPFSSLNNVL